MSHDALIAALSGTVEVTHDGDTVYRNQRGEMHRVGGPAVITAAGSMYWYQNGRLHRTDGPAVEYFNGAKSWYIDNKYIWEDEFASAVQFMKQDESV